jgi:hypothetical protein
MADLRIVPAMRIADLDSGNEVDVSATGEMAAEIRIALPAGTNNIGDVDVLSLPALPAGTNNIGDVDVLTLPPVDTELPAAAALADNTANPTAPAVASFPHIYDGATWDRLPGTSADGMLVNLGANNDVTFSGAVDTELPAAAALADNTANPTAPAVGSFSHVFDGSTWDRTPGNSTDGLLVNLGANNDVSITETAPTNPVASALTSAAVAAGASATLDTADIPGKKGRAVHATASVPFKGVISTVANGVATVVAVVFGAAGELVQWTPPHRDFFTVAGATAGQDGLRIVMTNLDTSEAADVYATIFYSDN